MNDAASAVASTESRQQQQTENGSRDARERERERARELEREAERERERAREKEISAFREFSTMLPIKQTRRSRGSSFLIEQQEAAAKAQSAALQAQWSNINGLTMTMGNVNVGNPLSIPVNPQGGGGGGYLGPLGHDPSKPSALLQPVGGMHNLGGVGSAALISAMNANTPGHGGGYNALGAAGGEGFSGGMGGGGLNSIMQQQMHIGDQLSNQHASNAAAAMNMHGRKTPRSVPLTMPPLDGTPGGVGPSAPPGSSHQRLRAGGRPQLSQAQASGVAGAPWEAVGGGMGMPGMGASSSSAYAPGPLHHSQQLQQQQHQQQQAYGSSSAAGGGSLLMPPQGALPNIMTSNYGNVNLAQHQQQLGHSPQHQHQLQQPRMHQQQQYGYEVDFSAASGGGGGSSGATNPNSGYAGMQQQLANSGTLNMARRQASRENAALAAAGGGLAALPHTVNNSFAGGMGGAGAGMPLGGNYNNSSHHMGGPGIGLVQQQPQHGSNTRGGNPNTQHRNHNSVRSKQPTLLQYIFYIFSSFILSFIFVFRNKLPLYKAINTDETEGK